jgi:hypothetical protein
MSQSEDITITYWSENFRRAAQNDNLVAHSLNRYANAQNLNEQALAQRLKIDLMQMYQLGMLAKPNSPAEMTALAGGMRIDPELLDLILSNNYTISREFYVFKLENYSPIQVAGPFFSDKEAYAEAEKLTAETNYQHIVSGKVREMNPERPKPSYADSPYAQYYELFKAIDDMQGHIRDHIAESWLIRYYRHLEMLIEEDLPKFEPGTPVPPEITKAQEYVKRAIKEGYLIRETEEEIR